MSAVDRSVVSALDAIEAEAYSDLFAAAPPPIAHGMGLAVEHIAGATLLHASAAPIALFNRVIGLGHEAPATEAAVDAVIAAYRARGAKLLWVHVGPAAQPTEPWIAAMVGRKGWRAYVATEDSRRGGCRVRGAHDRDRRAHRRRAQPLAWKHVPLWVSRVCSTENFALSLVS